MTIEIRTLTEADREAGFNMRIESFTGSAGVDFDEKERYAPDERRIGAFLDGRMLAHAAVWDFSMLVGPDQGSVRSLPMGGIGAVAVQPDQRGTGLGRRVMHAVLELMQDQGDVISTLFPSTPAFYRGLGWENAGVRVVRRVPAPLLSGLPRPNVRDEVRPLDFPTDLDAIATLIDSRVASHPGALVRSRAFHERMLEPEPDDGLHQYVAVRDGEVVGYLGYERSSGDPTHPKLPQDVRVHDCVGVDRDAWLTLWHVVASGRTVVRQVRFTSEPNEPLMLELPSNAVDALPDTHTFMARLVDAAAAVAGRGWPTGADVECHLDIDDRQVAGNAGAHVLRIKDGIGELAPGGAGHVKVGIGTLSAMFTGQLPADTAAWTGRLPGASADDVQGLSAAMTAPTPWFHDYF